MDKDKENTKAQVQQEAAPKAQPKKELSGKVELPAVTLRGLTLTPGTKIKMAVGRVLTANAFKAVAEGQYPDVLAFLQKDETVITPDRSGIYDIGVICHLVSFEPKREKDGRQIAVVLGYRRVRLIDFKAPRDGAGFPLATAEVLEEKAVDKDREARLKEILRASVDAAREKGPEQLRSTLSEVLPHAVYDKTLGSASLSTVTDVLTQVLDLDQATKVLMLTSTDPVERAQTIITLLNGYNYRAELQQKIFAQAKAAIERNQKEYYLNEQLRAIKKELGQDDVSDDEIAEYRRRAAALKAPEYVHKRLDREIKKLAAMSGSNSESTMERNYIDTLLSIPWEERTEVSHDLVRAKKCLDEDHYGLDKVKDRILEYLAVQAKSDRIHGPIICLMGPPGIGKTSLGQSIAKATGRKFVRMSLGGVYDEAEIRGHRRTYIGALPGRIISNIIKAGVNNPLFLLDEIDKVGQDNVHGDPASALLEVLDPEQNKSFQDNYLELDYDLSNVMFVTTANSYSIPEPLLDRMEIIDLSSYTEDEKFRIAKDHLIGKEMRLASLTPAEFSISDDALTELIRYYTHEAGVRGLERLINGLCRKSIKEDLLSRRKGSRARRIKMRTIGVADIQKMFGPRRYDFTSRLKENKVGLVNGLAWTSLGGDILQLEVAANPGKGKHILTGKLGDVMKESITAAITLVRTLSPRLRLDPSFYEKCDIHVHVPEGATPKEGPSAGVGMVTGIVSAITGNPVRADVAMTGEITLRGDVLPIGGLKEKLLAALRGGIRTVLIPKENEKDLWDMPDKIKKGIEIVPVSRIEEVLSRALENDPGTFTPTTEWKALDHAKESASGDTRRGEAGAQ
ncbi:MAG: endopeptidase La [Succinivibrio sp.]|nr:endopeptidase La [Succinivibrio sp.]